MHLTGGSSQILLEPLAHRSNCNRTLPQSPMRTGSSVWAGSPCTTTSSVVTDALPPLSLASSPGAAGFAHALLPQALVRLSAISHLRIPDRTLAAQSASRWALQGDCSARAS